MRTNLAVWLMCFGACEHQHRNSGPRGADYAELLKTCQMDQFRNGFSADTVAISLRNPKFMEIATVAAPKWSKTGSGCPMSVIVYSLLKILLAKRKNDPNCKKCYYSPIFSKIVQKSL